MAVNEKSTDLEMPPDALAPGFVFRKAPFKTYDFSDATAWTVECWLARGAFAHIYRVRDETGQVGALKHFIAGDDGKPGNVRSELSGYRSVQQPGTELNPAILEGFNQLLDPPLSRMIFKADRVAQSTQQYLVTGLLGPSLKEKPPPAGDATVLRALGLRLLATLRGLHEKPVQGDEHGYVFRDLKPENVCWPADADDPARVVLIDLESIVWRGGPRSAVVEANGHVCGLTVGTPQYAGCHYLNGASYSRRDDLDALGQMLAEMGGFSLPWARLHYPASQRDAKAAAAAYAKAKTQLPSEYLRGVVGNVRGEVLAEFITAARSLQADPSMGPGQPPDYSAFDALLHKL